jgi:hypothetical protein
VPAEQSNKGIKRWKLWICPECGEQVSEGCNKPVLPGRGHYHDNPKNRFHRRIFHPAEVVEVIPADAPCVLSEEEASRCAALLKHQGGTLDRPLAKRLADFAKEGSDRG